MPTKKLGNISLEGTFDFTQLAKEIYGCSVHCGTIKSIYNPELDKSGIIRGRKTSQTCKIGVYGLFHKDKLKKIGQAANKSEGVFHRMSQYYRLFS